MSDPKPAGPDKFLLWKLILAVFAFYVFLAVASQIKVVINPNIVMAVIMILLLIGYVWYELNQLWKKGLNFQFFLTDLFALAITLPPLAAFMLNQIRANWNDANTTYAVWFLAVQALAGIGGVMIGRINIQQQQEGGGLETQIGYCLVFQLLPFSLALSFVW